MFSLGLQSIRNALRSNRARAAVWLVLAAFVLQLTVTQAHFHFNAPQAGSSIAGLDSGFGGKGGPLPHDKANCLLWHAAGICGAALVGSALAYFVPTNGDTSAPIAPDAPHVERIAAIWQSRAPPTL